MSGSATLYPASPQRLVFALGLVVLGIAPEFIQRRAGYRTFAIVDVIANAARAAAGWLIAPQRIVEHLAGIDRRLPASH